MVGLSARQHERGTSRGAGKFPGSARDQALTTAGLRVPEDVAIIGYDDIAYAAAAAVPLSSIRQPREALGATAAQLLFEEIRAGGSGGGHHHRQVVFQPELVVRASSGLRLGD